MGSAVVDEALADVGSGDEKELVERLLGGDEQAMEAFADRYFPALYRFALGRLAGDRDLTRELVQATVCKALDKLASFRGEASLLTWLCACCRNEIAMHFRRHRRHPAASLEDQEVVDLERRGQDEALAKRQTAEQVHLALDHLPERYADALEWKYLEQLPVREIAHRLEIGPKAAESLLTRARLAFRDVYERLGGNPSRPALRPVSARRADRP